MTSSATKGRVFQDRVVSSKLSPAGRLTKSHLGVTGPKNAFEIKRTKGPGHRLHNELGRSKCGTTDRVDVLPCVIFVFQVYMHFVVY